MAQDGYLDSLMARGIVSPRAAEQLLAQQARDAAASRMQQAIQPDAGRQEGAISDYLDEQGRKLSDQLAGAASDVLAHPEHLVGPGELGVAWKGARVAAFRELMRAGKSFEEIGQRLGITPQAAEALAKKGGIPAGGMTDVWSAPGALDKLRDLAGQGLSFGEIGRQFGVSGSTVGNKVKELGIERPAREPWAAKVKKQSME